MSDSVPVQPAACYTAGSRHCWVVASVQDAMSRALPFAGGGAVSGIVHLAGLLPAVLAQPDEPSSWPG